MITEFRTANFKSWEDTGKLDFAPMTGFFGANSSGKTSILQILLMLKQTVERPSEWNEPLFFGDEASIVNLGNFDAIIHQHKPVSHLGVTVAWNLPHQININLPNINQHLGDLLSFSMSVNKKQEKPVLSSYCYTANNQRWKVDGGAQGFRFKFPDFLVETGFMAYTQGTIIVNPFRCYGVVPDDRLQPLLILTNAFEKLFSQIRYLGPLREPPRPYYTWEGEHPEGVGQHGQEMVSALLSGRIHLLDLDEQVPRWLQRLGLLDSYRLVPVSNIENGYEFFVTEHKGGPEVRLMDVGFGVSQILPVLILCYYVPAGSILILEQPGAHLHPKVQSDLADVLIDVVTNRNVQIILESHSEHLLHRLMRRIAERKISADDTALYACQINNGKSHIESLKMDDYGNVSNWPRDFFGDDAGDVVERAKAEIKRRKANKS